MDSSATRDDSARSTDAATIAARSPSQEFTKQRARPSRPLGFRHVLAWGPLLAVLLLGVVLVGVEASVAGAEARLGAAQTQARALYERVLAPCCWTQTLDIHESELADALRLEIVDRLAKGEGALAVEDDLARRFGERVRALPRGRDPRQAAAWFSAMLMAVSLLVLIVFARRWIASARAERGARADDDALVSLTPEEEAKLDRELERSLHRFDAN